MISNCWTSNLCTPSIIKAKSKQLHNQRTESRQGEQEASEGEMGRKPRSSKDGLNKGAWTPLEDKMLVDYFKIHGEGKWSNIVKETGLKRCGKSCRLRWMNYLRPNIKRGNISDDEEDLIIRLHKLLGNRWSLIAGRLPGRTDNEIKNYWHTYIAKKAQRLQFREQPKVDRKQIASGSQNGAASNFKNQSTIESQCTTGVVAATSTLHENTAQDHQDSIAVAQSTNSNLQHDMPKTYENESSSKELASGDDDNSSNIMMDYNYMEDFSKILDPDFTKFSDIHDIISTEQHPFNTMEVDGVSIDGCNSREIAEFPEKLLEADWSSNKCVQADQGFDFMSLLSFLDSTDDDEWTGDALGTKVP